MTRAQLVEQIRSKRSMLCVGLDSDPSRIPAHLGEGPDAMLAFNKAIIEATSDVAVAYKPNLAFYEAQGAAGWQVLEETLKCIPQECFTIADAKRGDIGNTAKQYANAFLDRMGFDSITLSPYMGQDSISPFLGREGKWAIMLGLTSNPGAQDVQMLGDDRKVYEQVITAAKEWGAADELMFVVGATRPEMLAHIRQLVPEHFFLVPGIGAQGGDLDAVLKAGVNNEGGLLINSSRGIIFASAEEDFAERARQKAIELQSRMDAYLQ